MGNQNKGHNSHSYKNSVSIVMQTPYNLSSEQNEKTENRSCWDVNHWLFQTFGIVSVLTAALTIFFFEEGVAGMKIQ